MKIGFVGLGVMGLPMALNLVKKLSVPVYGWDIMPDKLESFSSKGGIAVKQEEEIYSSCDVVLQMLPTHKTIVYSIEQMIKCGKNDSVIIDCSSTSPDIIKMLYPKVMTAGLHLIDAPVSGGNPGAINGTLAIMAGGEKKIFENVKPILSCMGTPTYVGGSGSGCVTKLINQIVVAATLIGIAEAYALAEKADLDLSLIFSATRSGFAGGPIYEKKVPMLIRRDFTPGARMRVHLKDLHNAEEYAKSLDVDLPLTELSIDKMKWMDDHHIIDEDQIAVIKYYEKQMNLDI